MPLTKHLFLLLPGLLLAMASTGALAERTDRSKLMTLESDQPCVVDLNKRSSVCSGNVVFSQGTLTLRAQRLELSEPSAGYQMAQALGSAGQPASYRQKRDGVSEHVEGQAQRIDYDSRAGTLRFEGQAVVRRLRDGVVADEIHGSAIVWDSVTEQFNVKGGAVTADNPGGRVRAVLSPRLPPEGADTTPAPAPALQPSTGLGQRR